MTLGVPDSAGRQDALYEPVEPAQPIPAGRPSLLGHVQIMRIDHWTKNVFVLPGVVAAVSVG